MSATPGLMFEIPVVHAEASQPKARRKRRVQVAVVSDVHLGTYGCHATELLRYLKSIRPQVLVLNGDIVDIWQFSKNYWPPAHMRVVRYLAGLAAKGVKIHYLTGNHDELLRKFAGLKLGNFRLDNKLVLDLPHGRTWLFHGDVFDVTMRHSRWLAKLGGHGYDLLILINRFVNYLLAKVGRPRVALSKVKVTGEVDRGSGEQLRGNRRRHRRRRRLPLRGLRAHPPARNQAADD